VERAIGIVERVLDVYGPPVYVRRQIVHNVHVVAALAERGAVFVDEVDQVPAGAPVVFSAHGVSPEVHRQARRRGLRVVDATCPLVSKVHAEVRRAARRGDTVVLVGHPGHEEIQGTRGEASEATVVISTADEVAGLDVADPARVSYLTQTTLAVDETEDVVATLTARFPAARGPSGGDICYAATNRQAAVRALTDDTELVLVLGSANSANSRRLVELAERLGVPAHLIDGPADLREEWFAGVTSVGVTAGASAPPALVDDVVAALRRLGPVTVTERVTAVEDVHFTPPPIGDPR
jgi:4-hydroxy-3-methylbut-2-enyl diphosphate reductase